MIGIIDLKIYIVSYFLILHAFLKKNEMKNEKSLLALSGALACGIQPKCPKGKQKFKVNIRKKH